MNILEFAQKPGTQPGYKRPTWFDHRVLKSTWIAFIILSPNLARLHSAAYEIQPLTSREESSSATTLFEKVPSSYSGAPFEMNLPNVAQRFRELLQLAALGGVSTGDINGDGLADFFISSPLGGSRIFQNLGDFKFKDITKSSGLNQTGFWATGANFIDINNDGRLDLYICGYRMPNRLYINEGPNPDGHIHFTEQAKKLGLDYSGGSMQMYFADMDRDGDLDAYLATTAVPPPPGVKFQVRFEGKKPVVPEALKEYWGLIYLPDEKAHPSENGQYDHLFRNDGKQFTEITREAGIKGPHLTLGAIWWDFNRDEWPDLYVANDYLGPDLLYLNQRDGTFKDVIVDQIPHTPWSSMGVDIGDLNNDGWMDLIASDMMGSTHYRRQVMMGESSRKAWFLDFAEPRQYSRNAVHLNTGTGRFMEIAYLSGMAATDWTWAPRIEDFDSDGRVDVIFTNGMLRDVQHSDLANYADRTFGGGTPDWASWWSEQSVRKESNLAFRNQGNMDFKNVSQEWGLNQAGVSFGMATADFDNDGDLDLVINNADGPLTLLRNQSVHGNRIMIQLIGTQSNRHGIGAALQLETNGQSQTRQVIAGRSWLSGSEPVTHFGLGEEKQIDRLTVHWPSGVKQVLNNIAINKRIKIYEPESGDIDLDSKASGKSLPKWFTESALLGHIAYQSKEFDDFTLQSLLPIRPSKTHFAMAWGDVDQDGDVDGFIGGGLGHAGSFYLAQTDGQFIEQKLPISLTEQTCFDSDAIFVDIDQDDDLDLVVTKCSPMPGANANVSGIALYLNDGQGRFNESPSETFPSILPFVGCIAAGDIDGDNDLDLYLGGGPTPGKYPLGAPGYLLMNVEGKWVDATPDSLKQFWLAKDALWTDINGDQQPELLIATTWGSIRCIQFHEGAWADVTQQTGLSDLSGWWSAIKGVDLDQDGDTDYIVGNLGLNTGYQPSSGKPDWLILGDFDENGRHELLETYFEGGTQYPRRGFDPLSRSMPFLREMFLNFHQFSVTDVASMFPANALQKAYKVSANTAASGVLMNLGNLKFEFNPLPRIAQAAPINDWVLTDFNRDGHTDILAAQNDFSPQNAHGRMDGGTSIILQGNGDGTFEPVPAVVSGIVYGQEARRVSLVDLNGDHLEDIVFGTSGGPLKVFIRQ